MKRIISTLLIVVLLIGLMPTIAFATSNEFAGGSGTASDPYLIETKYHLDNVRNYLDSYFKMIADIEFTDADFAQGGDFYNNGEGFVPIGTEECSFEGVFDGNGFVIKNLYFLASECATVGLFVSNEGTIKNLGLVYREITASSSATFSYAIAGGITGVNTGTIMNCYNTGSITAAIYSGGIAGFNLGTIMNCYNTGSITALFSFYSYIMAGGITGRNTGTITNCYNTGGITTSSSASDCVGSAGGIAGGNDEGTIENCYNTGSVTASSSSLAVSTGGITGVNTGTITNCYNTGSITTSSSASDCEEMAGGIAGVNGEGTIENCYNTGFVSSSDAGGIAGRSDGTIEDCYYANTILKGVGEGADTATKCTDAELKSQSTYIGFDFKNVWTMEGSECYPYPFLNGLANTFHIYDNACDATCDCGYVRVINHDYQSIFDESNHFSKCSVCGDIVNVEAHIFDNTNDTTCNRCGAIRVDKPHFYSNDCDTTCNECGAERTITHTYSYSCDATCDVCGDERTVTHDYQPAYDSDDHYKKCSVCGDKIEIAAHVFDDNFDTNCNICGATVKKNIDAPSAPTLSEKTTTSIILTLVDGYEYSMDGIKWQKNPVFSGLTANTEYTFYQRIGETDTNYASSSSPVLLVTTAKYMAKEPKSPVVIAVSPTSITLAPYTGYEYSMDGVVWQDDNHFTGLIANTKYTFCQRIAEINDTCHSVVSAEVKATTLVKNPCSISPIAPIIESYTTSSVTLVAIDGYEYRRGTEGTWQDSTVFDGLSSNSSYTFYQRIKECDDELASVSSAGVSAKTLSTSSGTTSATNYDQLRSYIANNGTTNSNGIKTIVRASTVGNETWYYALENQSNGIKFVFLTSGSGTRIVGTTEFTLVRNSKSISAYCSLLYYYGSTLVDSVYDTTSIDRSQYSPPQTVYNLYDSGQYLDSADLSDRFNSTLEILCDYFDIYIYSNLGFGLKGLGFKSFSGKGSSVCDAPSSYHTGSHVVRFSREARCTIDGYTGDTYCSTCNTKLSSGSSISSVGHHEYSDACDNTCNICNEERRINHVYDGACDYKCNICEKERAMIEHTYEDACDDTCNECGHKRNAPHQCDNCEDLICAACGATRSAESHDYDDTCDTTCNKCGVERIITHTYSNDCDIKCNVCHAIRSVGPHQYDNDCDTICNECEETRNVEPHAYDDTCDTTCNKCGAVRTITHTYTNACDTSCNVCAETRTITHTYSNACDTYCNICGAIRTVGDHQYTNACDTTCNICGNTRTVGGHKYDNACDKDCNVCKATRTPAAHKGGTATCKEKAKCSVCGVAYGNLAAHKFGAYIYNNDATASKDGTKTRVCSVCQKTETITATGTKLKNPFKDVKLNQYYAEPVLWAVGKGITNGMTANTFAPNNDCTRGQIVTFLWRAAGSPEPTSIRNPFKDVKSNAYYYKAVLWAVEKGITNGTSANTFSPDATCTRAQVVTFLWRAKGSPKVSATNPFKDVKKSYYSDAVLWAVKNNITTGTSATTFSPDATCTRGQIVTFLYRAYK